MVAVNPNWARWIFASVMTHLKAVQNQHPFLIEGVDQRTDTILRSPLWAEARLTGPFAIPLQGEYRLTIDTNVLLTANPSSEPYELNRLAGLYQKALSEPIPVWNYGSLTGDYVPSDPSTKVLLGCLSPKPGKAEPISVFHFGKIENTTEVRQSLVDATLEIYLTPT